MASALAVPRPMVMADVAEIWRIERAAYPFPWSKSTFADCLYAAGYSNWVLANRDTIFAYAVFSVAAGEAHILNLCVNPACQGKGYGKRMLEQLLDVARGHSAETVFLEVRPSNTAALKLYEGSGFGRIGRRRGYYPGADGREDALVYSLSIPAPQVCS